nr:hypothetical protein [uncultured Allomuricauda sp.]
MKKCFLLLLIFWTVSCSDDDSNPENATLDGEWTLTNVSCFCGFPDLPEFESTTVLFDVESDEITVSHTGSFEYFRPNGTYSYSVSGSEIRMMDGRSYEFDISENTLFLRFVDEPTIADDEILYTFIRN